MMSSSHYYYHVFLLFWHMFVCAVCRCALDLWAIINLDRSSGFSCSAPLRDVVMLWSASADGRGSCAHHITPNCASSRLAHPKHPPTCLALRSNSLLSVCLQTTAKPLQATRNVASYLAFINKLEQPHTHTHTQHFYSDLLFSVFSIPFKGHLVWLHLISVQRKRYMNQSQFNHSLFVHWTLLWFFLRKCMSAF